jgi:hypothetical protein
MKNKTFKFKNISGLIERDGDIKILTGFLKQLHTEKCGIFRIVATHGSGATSFLNHSFLYSS